MQSTAETMAAALREAIRRVGSQVAMARLLGITQPSVWAWVNRDKPLPAEHVLLVEEHTGVSRHDLRPDLYPRNDETPTPAAPPLIERAGS